MYLIDEHAFLKIVIKRIHTSTVGDLFFIYEVNYMNVFVDYWCWEISQFLYSRINHGWH